MICSTFSYNGVISVGGQPLNARAWLQFKPQPIICWNMDKWFYEYVVAESIVESEAQCSAITLQKKEFGGPATCALDTTMILSGKSEVLMFDGSWKTVFDVVVGDKLQHYCGTGHYAIVTDVREAERRRVFLPVCSEKHVDGFVTLAAIVRNKAHV